MTHILRYADSSGRDISSFAEDLESAFLRRDTHTWADKYVNDVNAGVMSEAELLILYAKEKRLIHARGCEEILRSISTRPVAWYGGKPY